MTYAGPGSRAGNGYWSRSVSSVLVAAWWAFRPEKLWINQKVSEPAPFASTTDPQPLYTGRLERKAHQTSGRATDYKTPGRQAISTFDGFHRRRMAPMCTWSLRGATTKTLTRRSSKATLIALNLGRSKATRAIRITICLQRSTYRNTTRPYIYCERFHAVFGVARLEQF